MVVLGLYACTESVVGAPQVLLKGRLLVLFETGAICTLRSLSKKGFSPFRMSGRLPRWCAGLVWFFRPRRRGRGTGWICYLRSSSGSSGQDV